MYEKEMSESMVHYAHVSISMSHILSMLCVYEKEMSKSTVHYTHVSMSLSHFLSIYLGRSGLRQCEILEKE